jgi:hypothetical protein
VQASYKRRRTNKRKIGFSSCARSLFAGAGRRGGPLSKAECRKSTMCGVVFGRKGLVILSVMVHPTILGSHSPSPTATAPDGLLPQRIRMSIHPTDNHSPSPTLEPPDGLLSQPLRMSIDPKDSHSPSPTVAPPGGPLPQPMRMSICPQGHPFSLAHFSTFRWPPFAAAAHVQLLHQQPFSLAHFSTSRWPPSAASVQIYMSHS